MNKFKKLTVAAVSVVMAGTMAVSFTACGKKVNNSGDYHGADEYGILKDDGFSLNYDVYQNRGNVTLNVAVGHEKLVTSTSFQDLGGSITLPDRTEDYKVGDMKPAWAQMGKDLNITWHDVYEGKKTSDNLKTLLTENDTATNKPKYNGVDMFTTDLSVAVSYSTAGTADILNLAEYLDSMPNFRQFLNENPVVYLSRVQDGMSTKDGSGQKILVAPYFDGYDDIERYCIIRHDWAKALLNGSESTGSTAKYADECAAATSVVSFMGKDNYTVDALTADGKGTQKITKNYGAALTAAKDASKPLGAAYSAIAGEAYGGDSGNIVDIMNAALAKNANASGAQLVDLFRAYIDVAFVKADNTAAYTADNRANVFIGYDAAWDADDLVAMLRCVKTNASKLVASGKKLGGIAPRDGTNDRTPDIVSLACQLFGVRGGTSRNEFTYINSKGNIVDARTEKKFYEAMAKMNTLLKEGLIADYSGKADFATGSGIDTKTGNQDEYFMVYDYSQTQTLNGFYAEDPEVTGVTVPKGYYFAPIITPVSKWDVDGNGKIAADEYFRFTESWRSTKTGGLAVNGAVRDDKNKLDAVLQFVDYLYSQDGRIVSTFGPMAEDATGKGGYWYNAVAGENDTDVFYYKGVKYKGTEYKGHYTPTITENLYKSFKGLKVNGWQVTQNDKVKGAKLSFTNYARMLIGSTLPVGVKDQSFENQLTSKMGQAGANVVATALDKKNGVIKGMSLELDKDNYWFTCSPTGLPVNSTQQSALDHTSQANFKYMTGTKKGDSKNFFSIMNYIVLNGTAATYNEQDVVVTYTSIEDLLNQKLGGDATIMELAVAREYAYNDGWKTAKKYWDYLSKNR